MGAPSRVFKLEFASAKEFQREHSANLVNGGVFIATEEPATLREFVSVELSLRLKSNVCLQRSSWVGTAVQAGTQWQRTEAPDTIGNHVGSWTHCPNEPQKEHRHLFRLAP